MKKLVYESLGDLLKPKGAADVLDHIKNLSVDKKIEKIKEMEQKWGSMYKNLINTPAIVEDIRSAVSKELDKLSIIEKVNYIEKLEKKLPDIFSGMRDDKLVNDLKNYILDQKFEDKAKLVWRFFKTWPDLFSDIEDDPRIDPETNQLMLLFKIKGAIDKDQVEELQEFIHEMGEKYGRKSVLEKASSILIPDGYHESNLFNKKDLEQLKLSLYKETRSEEETIRDEYFDVYAFIGYPDFVEKEIDGEKFHKKRLGIENLVKLDKYSSSSLAQVPMMKVRAQHQYGGEAEAGVWAVYIPKHDWDKDYAHNSEIPDSLRKFIEENKFKI